MGASIHPDFAPYQAPTGTNFENLLQALSQRRTQGIQQQQADIEQAKLPLEARRVAAEESRAKSLEAERIATEGLRAAEERKTTLAIEEAQRREKDFQSFFNNLPETVKPAVGILHNMTTLPATVQEHLWSALVPGQDPKTGPVVASLFHNGLDLGTAMEVGGFPKDKIDQRYYKIKPPPSATAGLREEQDQLKVLNQQYHSTQGLLDRAARDIEAQRKRLLQEAQKAQPDALVPPAWNDAMQHQLNAFILQKYPHLSDWRKDMDTVRGQIMAHGKVAAGYTAASALEDQVSRISALMDQGGNQSSPQP